MARSHLINSDHTLAWTLMSVTAGSHRWSHIVFQSRPRERAREVQNEGSVAPEHHI